MWYFLNTNKSDKEKSDPKIERNNNNNNNNKYNNNIIKIQLIRTEVL